MLDISVLGSSGVFKWFSSTTVRSTVQMLVIRSGMTMKEVRKKGLWLNYSGTKQPLQCWGWSARTGFSTHQQCCTVSARANAAGGDQWWHPRARNLCHTHTAQKAPWGLPRLQRSWLRVKYKIHHHECTVNFLCHCYISKPNICFLTFLHQAGPFLFVRPLWGFCIRGQLNITFCTL